jgi:hypothetical protein
MSGYYRSMSFWISVDDIDPASGVRKSVALPSNAGGFQSWGREVYGSDLAIELGLSILPRLAADGYLESEGADLQRVRDEAMLLHAHAHRLGLDDCAEPTFNRVDPDGTRHNVVVGGPTEDEANAVAAVRDRLENIMVAAEIALALGTGRGRLSIT